MKFLVRADRCDSSVSKEMMMRNAVELVQAA
jgi:hypothetical protein